MDTSVVPMPSLIVPGTIQFFGVAKLTTKKESFIAFAKIR